MEVIARRPLTSTIVNPGEGKQRSRLPQQNTALRSGDHAIFREILPQHSLARTTRNTDQAPPKDPGPCPPKPRLPPQRRGFFFFRSGQPTVSLADGMGPRLAGPEAADFVAEVVAASSPYQAIYRAAMPLFATLRRDRMERVRTIARKMGCGSAASLIRSMRSVNLRP